MQEVTLPLNTKRNSSEPQLCLYAHRMARSFLTMTGLLLLSLIPAGVNGDSPIPAGRSDVTLPHAKAACCYLWRFSSLENSDFIAIVANEDIQTSSSYDDDSCRTLQTKDVTEDDGNHRCNQTSTDAGEVILVPGKTSALQCVLTNSRQERCRTQEITLTWVDGDGAHIPEDHRIHRRSSCDVTLRLAPQSPVRKKFRCLVAVGDQVQTSANVWVGFPGRGRGRGIIEPETGHQGGHSWDIVGAAVGVVGCVALTALIAAFAANRKRANRQLPNDSCNTISSNHVMNTDDVVYAEIVLPDGSDAVWVQECEATEYACIRYE